MRPLALRQHRPPSGTPVSHRARLGPGGWWLAAALVGLTATACGRRTPAPAPSGTSAPAGSAPGPGPASVDPAVLAELAGNDEGRAGGARPSAHANAQTRLVQQRAYDSIHVDEHRALLAFVKKTRARYDQAATQLRGRPASVGARRIEQLQASQQRSIGAQIDALQGLDPTGSQSSLTADHGTNLNFLADEYPAAIIGALAGDPQPLEEIRAEMDRHQQNIQSALQNLTRRR
jgi:hypothetical protein